MKASLALTGWELKLENEKSFLSCEKCLRTADLSAFYLSPDLIQSKDENEKELKPALLDNLDIEEYSKYLLKATKFIFDPIYQHQEYCSMRSEWKNISELVFMTLKYGQAKKKLPLEELRNLVLKESELSS